MIAVLDYGLGNVGAFINVYKSMNIPVRLASKAEDLDSVQKIILPGVGSFDLAMHLFQNSDVFERVKELVLEKGIPILGICVGMQMIASSSEEGTHSGLGWIPGIVKKIDTTKLKTQTQLPHMGWNDIKLIKESPLFNDLSSDSRFYFLHSYYYHAFNDSDVIANVEYGDYFPCVINKDNIFGVQFHPEKSHKFGARLLKNFAEL